MNTSSQEIPKSSLRQRMQDRAAHWFLAPASARPLAVFRIGIAVVLLAQAMSIAGDIQELYGSRGVVQWSVLDSTERSSILFGMPRIRWVADWLGPWGISEAASVRGVFLLYVGALSCLLLGYRTRIAAILAWLTHLSMNVTGQATIYGVDSFAHIALFYMTWMPVGAAISVDRAAGRIREFASSTARLSLRMLQLHLCVVYLASGIEKGSGPQWWNGEAIWRALMLPELAQFDFSWMASVPWLAMVMCWGTLLLEVGYPFFIMPRRTRTLWAVSTIGLHAGIGISMGLASFSCLMCVLTFSAFLVPETPSFCRQEIPILGKWVTPKLAAA